MTETATDIIIRLLTERPSVTMAEIVAEAGVSRQRVHQILKAKGFKAGPKPAVFRPSSGRRQPSAKATPKPRTVEGCAPREICSTHIGIVSELLVAADLMARGWYVFTPLARSRCDLIAASYDCQVLKRIEVRSGKRIGSKLTHGVTEFDVCDHYAIVVEGEPIIYAPELAEAPPRPRMRPPTTTTVFR